MDYIADDLEGEAPCEFCGELYPLVLLIEHQTIHLTDGDYSYLEEVLTHEEAAQNVIAENIELSSKPEVIVEQTQQSAANVEPKIIFEEKQQSAVKNQTNPNEGNSATAAPNPDSAKTKTSTESAKAEQKRSASESYDQILYSQFKRRRNLSSSSSSGESDEDFLMGEPKDEELDGDDEISVVYETKTENATAEQKLFSKTLKDIKKFPEQKGKEFITEKGEKLLVYGDEIDPDKELENEKPAYKMPNNPLLSSVLKNEDVEDINNLSDDDCNESLEEFWKRARDFLKRNRARNETSC